MVIIIDSQNDGTNYYDNVSLFRNNNGWATEQTIGVPLFFIGNQIVL
jgi:hypothetical protein